MADFDPDWKQVWTLEEANKELNVPGGFSKPGWYFHKGDSLLVLPSPRYSEKEYFTFLIYNGRDPRNDFRAVADMEVIFKD